MNSKYSARNVFGDLTTRQLALATKNGDIQEIDRLLSTGFNIDTQGKYGYTALYWNFLHVPPNDNTKRGFEHLLKKGANAMHISSNTKHPLLHLVVQANDIEYLELLLEHGQNLDLNFQDEGPLPDFDSPLSEAITIGKATLPHFKLLIEHGANIEQKDISNDTPLENVSGNGAWMYALELIKNGANYRVGENDKSNGNPLGLSTIVFRIENLQYWPEVAADAHGEDYRQKVIDFIRAEGVEVYPWYPEDDPRYNPRPPMPESFFAAVKKYNRCIWNYERRHKTYKTQEFKDVNLYKDLSPNFYSHESQSVYGLAMINLKQFSYQGDNSIIEVELFGRDQDVYSHYIYDTTHGDKLDCVVKTQDIYKPNRTQADSKIDRTIKSTYVLDEKTCHKQEGDGALEPIPFEKCEDFVSDASTYRRYAKSR